jgi:hypothetical protein
MKLPARSSSSSRGTMARWAQQFGDDLSGMEKVWGVWAAGGSLGIEQIGKSTYRLDFNVTRCQYAKFYKELGRVTAFRNGMHALGWTEGRNIRFEIRFTAGDADRSRRQAAEWSASHRT